MHRNILVTGATGKQGGALIRALLEQKIPSPEDHEYCIYALTRDVSSPSAKQVAEIGERVVLVNGDLDAPETIAKIFEDVKAVGGMWGVFSVLAFPGLGADASGEEAQGKVGYYFYLLFLVLRNK
jgi:uncharacterized protein YbjT (DUF2867 family)